MPGPPPKPTAIKAAEGNPGKRPLGPDILLAPQEPEQPDWLDDDGRKIWDQIMPGLMEMGVLRNTDGLQLANLCDACSIMLQAKRSLMELPPGARLLTRSGAKTNPKGEQYGGRVGANPLIGIINRQREILHRLCSEFGMSPAARARVMNPDTDLPVAGIDNLEALLASPAEESRYLT